ESSANVTQTLITVPNQFGRQLSEVKLERCIEVGRIILASRGQACQCHLFAAPPQPSIASNDRIAVLAPFLLQGLIKTQH
ncbi:MAG: hypothetical protein ACKO7W_19700, partial [Elainella sp.]